MAPKKRTLPRDTENSWPPAPLQEQGKSYIYDSLIAHIIAHNKAEQSFTTLSLVKNLHEQTCLPLAECADVVRDYLERNDLTLKQRALSGWAKPFVLIFGISAVAMIGISARIHSVLPGMTYGDKLIILKRLEFLLIIAISALMLFSSIIVFKFLRKK